MQCFFVTVRAGTAYQKIWRLINNFVARIIRFTVQKFQLLWVIFCIIIFFIELWHILILWCQMGACRFLRWLPPDDGTGKYSFTKKALVKRLFVFVCVCVCVYLLIPLAVQFSLGTWHHIREQCGDGELGIAVICVKHCYSAVMGTDFAVTLQRWGPNLR